MTSSESPVAGLPTRPATGTTWRDNALCAQTDPELFFPEKGRAAHDAIAICRSCDVQKKCLEWALVHGEHGIWGGTTESDRRKLRRARPDQPTLYNVARVVRDATIHLLTARGLSTTEVAQQAGCDERTVTRVRTAARKEAA